MNLLLAFLSVDVIALLITLLVTVGVLVGVPLLFYLWLRQTELPALYLALAYLLPVAVLCVLPSVAEAHSKLSSVSVLSSFILTLPWSALARWGLQVVSDPLLSDSEYAVMMLLCAGVNAVILYFVGVRVRRPMK